MTTTLEEQTQAMTAILDDAHALEATISTNLHRMTPAQQKAAVILQADTRQSINRFINMLHS